MHLEPGATLKQYRIVALLGKGGMGEVYAADDTKLGRKVAIKILPAALAGDAERLRRFTQEAKAASALNHPSILTIHDVDDVDGHPFLVTELIEGQTLRERMRRGELPLREAVEIAGEVASALAAAHAAGIVHRDVKPENIMLREDGHAKLLDFGLAKLGQDAAAAGSGSTDETVAAAGHTTPGMVMGTTAYMSPEQARGLPVDGRSDIFSLGVVLYEMAAGRAPFPGATASDVIAAILRADPPAIADLPPELEHTLRKALEKERDERHQTAKDLAADLKRLRRRLDPASPGSGSTSRDSANSHGSQVSTATVPARGPSRWIAVSAVGAIVLVGIVIAIAWWSGARNGTSGIASFSNMTIEKVAGLGQVTSPVISPDGKVLAFVKTEAAEQAIWLRQMATGSVVKVVGPTPNAITNLRFTHDGNFLYYSEATPVRPIRYTLMAVPTFGGTAREVAEGRFWPVSFSPDGKRLVAMRESPANWELVVMNAEGSGEASVIATRARSGSGFNSPSWSPSGAELAAIVDEGSPSGVQSAIQIMKPDGTEPRTLTPAGAPQLSELCWTSTDEAVLAIGDGGQVLLIRTSDGQLEHLTKDVSSFHSLSFSAAAETVATAQTFTLGSIWIGEAGRPEEARELAGQLREISGNNGLTWLNDRALVFTRLTDVTSLWTMNVDGTGERRLTEGLTAMFPRASRDGRLVLFTAVPKEATALEINRLTLPDGRLTQVTHENGVILGTPSHDGRAMFFRRNAATPPVQLLSMPLDGGPATPVFEAGTVIDFAVSPDGAQLAVIANSGVGTPRTISLLAAGGGPARTIFTTGANLNHIRWYPSGAALLFTMIENRQANIYRLDLAGGPARQLTRFTRGHVLNPEISPDGRRIAYYRGNFETDIVLLKRKE